MDNPNPTGTLFHTEVMRGIYQITSTLLSPTGEERSLAPGNPTQNAYLVVGDNEALLFDLPLENADLKEYAERLAAKPMRLVLSHGHYDHVFNLNRFSDVWMHPADEVFLCEGMPLLGMPPVEPCPAVHHLNDGGTIDLGERILTVFHVPGHTNGSILLLDEQTGTLLSGDTGARRLLYGMHGPTPLKEFCGNLRRLQAQDFDVMYSVHDRCALPKAYLEYMARCIENELPHTQTVWEHPAVGKMVNLVRGDVYTLRYFDVAVPAEYLV